jgi:hypothetical protein
MSFWPSAPGSPAPLGNRQPWHRGVGLWLIFLAHIPGNLVSGFVPFHYGFSDPAEMFVFVSGYANAYVYGRVMQQRGFVTSAAHILNRAFHLYVAQMFLFVVFIGEIALLSHGTDVFADAMNVRVFREQPDVATLAVLQVVSEGLATHPPSAESGDVGPKPRPGSLSAIANAS